MHQLGRTLLDLGHDARMVYATSDSDFQLRDGALDGPDIPSPMPEAYADYRVPKAMQVPDTADSAVVFPEVWPRLAFRFGNAQPHLWWLSIDNGLKPAESCGGIDALRASACVHLCQSYYALTYLLDRGIRGWPLFDYTSPDILTAAAAAETTRSARVLFPARGRWFTQWLQRWAPDLPWQEISGFTPAQVRDLFLTSRLYVDFGSHPGKDRMPREAAILGCCVITGRRGAAANALDLPIPCRYKFPDSRFMVPRIVRAIRRTLNEHEARKGDFEGYRGTIRGERREFILQAMRIFGGRLELPAGDERQEQTPQLPL
jgi:hypothetical protein